MFGDIQELLVIFIIAFLVVGPKKLPEVARVMGKFMGELKRALTEVRFEIDQEIRAQTNVDKAQEETKQAAREMEIKPDAHQPSPWISTENSESAGASTENMHPVSENVMPEAENIEPETEKPGPEAENSGKEFLNEDKPASTDKPASEDKNASGAVEHKT